MSAGPLPRRSISISIELQSACNPHAIRMGRVLSLTSFTDSPLSSISLTPHHPPGSFRRYAHQRRQKECELAARSQKELSADNDAVTHMALPRVSSNGVAVDETALHTGAAEGHRTFERQHRGEHQPEEHPFSQHDHDTGSAVREDAPMPSLLLSPPPHPPPSLPPAPSSAEPEPLSQPPLKKARVDDGSAVQRHSPSLGPDGECGRSGSGSEFSTIDNSGGGFGDPSIDSDGQYRMSDRLEDGVINDGGPHFDVSVGDVGHATATESREVTQGTVHGLHSSDDAAGDGQVGNKMRDVSGGARAPDAIVEGGDSTDYPMIDVREAFATQSEMNESERRKDPSEIDEDAYSPADEAQGNGSERPSQGLTNIVDGTDDRRNEAESRDPRNAVGDAYVSGLGHVEGSSAASIDRVSPLHTGDIDPSEDAAAFRSGDSGSPCGEEGSKGVDRQGRGRDIGIRQSDRSREKSGRGDNDSVDTFVAERPGRNDDQQQRDQVGVSGGSGNGGDVMDDTQGQTLFETVERSHLLDRPDEIGMRSENDPDVMPEAHTRRGGKEESGSGDHYRDINGGGGGHGGSDTKGSAAVRNSEDVDHSNSADVSVGDSGARMSPVREGTEREGNGDYTQVDEDVQSRMNGIGNTDGGTDTFVLEETAESDEGFSKSDTRLTHRKENEVGTVDVHDSKGDIHDVSNGYISTRTENAETDADSLGAEGARESRANVGRDGRSAGTGDTQTGGSGETGVDTQVASGSDTGDAGNEGTAIEAVTVEEAGKCIDGRDVVFGEIRAGGSGGGVQIRGSASQHTNGTHRIDGGDVMETGMKVPPAVGGSGGDGGAAEAEAQADSTRSDSTFLGWDSLNDGSEQ